jgi:hypothetical protein
MTTITEMLQQHGPDMMKNVSTQPWSDFKESDYTLEQWHNACLIHQHTGAPTSKAQCKLPVKTPNGTLNSNAVFAAAAALAGARGGVDATSEEKAKAKKALVGYYNKLNKPLPSFLQHEDVEDFFAHFGRKGMKWGQHIFSRDQVSTGSSGRSGTSQDHANVVGIKTTAKTSGVQALSNKQLQEAITRMNLERQFTTLSSGQKNKGGAWAKKFLLNVGQQQAQQAANQIAAKQIAKLLAKTVIG